MKLVKNYNLMSINKFQALLRICRTTTSTYTDYRKTTELPCKTGTIIPICFSSPQNSQFLTKSFPDVQKGLEKVLLNNLKILKIKYWVNSIWLILYMLFAVIMLVNLLVAMFATTYSNITDKAEVIWKHQRYKFIIIY